MPFEDPDFVQNIQLKFYAKHSSEVSVCGLQFTAQNHTQNMQITLKSLSEMKLSF